MVPSMIMNMTDLSDGQPALAGRVKAAAMQLLPPLLDGLHARRLAGRPGEVASVEHLQKWRLSNYFVSTTSSTLNKHFGFRDFCRRHCICIFKR